MMFLLWWNESENSTTLSAVEVPDEELWLLDGSEFVVEIEASSWEEARAKKDQLLS